MQTKLVPGYTSRLYERAGMHIKTHFVRFEKTAP